MATKAEKLEEIKSNVTKVVGYELKEDKLNLKTYDVYCLITTDETGEVFNKVSQRLYVENEGTEFENAVLGDRARKNYSNPNANAVPSNIEKERFFLQQLKTLETNLGGTQIKVDPTQMENLGIKYLVYEDPTDENKKKVTTTLDGETLIREAI